MMLILKNRQVMEWRERSLPERCPVMEAKIKNPHLDHDHGSGNVRGVLMGVANNLVGKCENWWAKFGKSNTALSLPDVMRNAADYIEADYSGNPLHPTHRAKIRKQFMRLSVAEQEMRLAELGLDPEDFSNKEYRAQAFLEQVLETTDELPVV